MEWAIEKRTGKIFIDYNMNVRGKTLNVAYSPRGVPGAPVSMPLTWEELEAAEPADFTLSQRHGAFKQSQAIGGMMSSRRNIALRGFLKGRAKKLLSRPRGSKMAAPRSMGHSPSRSGSSPFRSSSTPQRSPRASSPSTCCTRTAAPA